MWENDFKMTKRWQPNLLFVIFVLPPNFVASKLYTKNCHHTQMQSQYLNLRQAGVTTTANCSNISCATSKNIITITLFKNQLHNLPKYSKIVFYILALFF